MASHIVFMCGVVLGQWDAPLRYVHLPVESFGFHIVVVDRLSRMGCFVGKWCIWKALDGVTSDEFIG